MGERWKQEQLAEIERLRAEVARLEAENAELRALLAEDGVEVNPEPDETVPDLPQSDPDDVEYRASESIAHLPPGHTATVTLPDPAESLGSEPPADE